MSHTTSEEKCGIAFEWLVLEELERTLALLAFEEPEKSPYGDLLSFSGTLFSCGVGDT